MGESKKNSYAKRNILRKHKKRFITNITHKFKIKSLIALMLTNIDLEFILKWSLRLYFKNEFSDFNLFLKKINIIICK